MVIEQRFAAVVWNHIQFGCLPRSRKKFRGCRAKRIGRDAGMESLIPSLILIKDLCMKWKFILADVGGVVSASGFPNPRMLEPV